MTYRRILFAGLLVAASWALAPAPAAAQNHFALEITDPLPCDGAAEPDGDAVGARHCRAYPNLQYNHRVACIGGTYPYTYALEGAPAWLTVDSSGVMSGTPTNTTTDDDASITVRCTDAVAATTTRVFGVDVTTTGFVFVDVVNGLYRVGNGGCTSPCGTGTLANPYKDIEDLFDGTTSDSDITYFRGCSGCGTGANSWTYTTANMPVEGEDSSVGEEEIAWPANRSTIWLAYPGETPRIDFGYTGDGCLPWNYGLLSGVREPGVGNQPGYDCGQSVPRINMGSAFYYHDGLQLYRCMTMCFEVNRSSGRGATIRRMTLMSSGPGRDQGNSAVYTWERSSDHMTYGDHVESNVGIASGMQCGTTNSWIKTYDTHKMLIQTNTFPGGLVYGPNGSCDGLIALKGGPWKTTVRQNVGIGIASNEVWLGGNWAESDEPLNQQFSIEANFNLCISALTTTFGQGCVIANLSPGDFIEGYFWRNTFYGLVTFHSFNSSGPWEWRDNVVINADTGGTWPRVSESGNGTTTGVVYGTDPTTSTGNLLGGAADSIVNTTTGVLEGSYLTLYGPSTSNPKGFQLTDTPPTRRIPFSRRREP